MNRNRIIGIALIAGSLLMLGASYWTGIAYHQALPPWAYGWRVGALVTVNILGGAATLTLAFLGGRFIGHGHNSRSAVHR